MPTALRSLGVHAEQRPQLMAQSPSTKSPVTEPVCQLDLFLWSPSVVVPQGDGSVIVRPGKPIEYLTPLQFSKAVGYSRSAVYEQIGSPSIPERFIRRVGPRLIKIQAAAVPHFLEYWKLRRDGGIPPS